MDGGPDDGGKALEPIQRLPPDDPYAPGMGAPLKYPKEVIERCLFEIAVCGGNARRARQRLVQWDPELGWPTEKTMYGWVKGRFRNRYTEIATESTDELREQMARDATALSLRMADAERQALDATLAGLGDANAVEASLILRNLATAKKIQVDAEGQLRGRANVIVDHRGLTDITDALVRLGVGVPVEEITDGEVVED